MKSSLLANVVQSVQSGRKTFFRYITANDVGTTGSHQSGFYENIAQSATTHQPSFLGLLCNKPKLYSIKETCLEKRRGCVLRHTLFVENICYSNQCDK